ncbi:hypothetical protein [Xanthocytophaga agilis]|uniref:Uncharacterized protein n=1 Tax=Xanthocytophaga agilis TaxID=3048010 RepID=A0AAE3R458_9BACT|nr:hypothetical protein [Xanthocytophaga agilis]MDJ1501054.1 hypothetical protein [Xanthocytophaga agilis]
MIHPENQKKQEPAEAERDDHLKHSSQQITNQKQKPESDPNRKEDDLESGDNVAQRETDAMDETTAQGKRSISDDGF